jgi:DNA-binding protein H-NS
MAINLDNLSPKELQAVIVEANAKMNDARSNMIQSVRTKIDHLLNISGLTIAEVYSTRGGKKANGKTRSVAPKYRDPANPSVTWTGRGRQPLWFAKAIKKRGLTPESFLIAGATRKTAAKVPTKKTGSKKAVKKAG